ncbi:MAG: AI-2E family transporter [Oscillospiraceae bacterium]|nr:AI-2E family transporter [Oscillospiraceae bacterium]
MDDNSNNSSGGSNNNPGESESTGIGKKNKKSGNKKYTMIAVYSFIVILSSFAVILVILAVRDFFTEGQYIAAINIFMPIVYGLVFAYLLNPLMGFFKNRIFFKLAREKLKNVLSIISSYLTMGIIITLILLMIIPQVVGSVQQLTGIAVDWLSPHETETETENIDYESIDYESISNAKIIVYLHELGSNIQDYIDGMGLELNVQEIFDDISRNIMDFVTIHLTSAINAAIGVVYGAASGVINIILGLLLSIYLLAGKDKFIAQTKKLLFALCPPGFSYKTVNIMRKTHEIFGGFISGKILDSAIVGVICFVVMLIFGISYPTLISVIVAVFNIIPFFGPLIGGAIGALFLAINDLWETVWFVVFILILQQVDGNFIGPKILGPKVGMPAFWVIVAILVMSGIFGIPGFFFGVPVFAVIYVLVKEYAENKLKAKGFPTKTEQYIRGRGFIADDEEYGGNGEYGEYKGKSGEEKKKKSGKYVLINKTANKLISFVKRKK